MILYAAIAFISAFVLSSFVGVHELSLMLHNITLFILFSYAYVTTKMSKTKTRMCLLFSSCLSASYIAIITMMYVTGQGMLDSAHLLLVALISFALVRTYIIKFRAIDSYKTVGTFLAYKRPKNAYGYFAALFWGYGSVRLVIDCREFKFHKGTFIEKNHIGSGKYTYKRVDNIPLEEARLMVGEDWKWYKNCFIFITRKLDDAKIRHSQDNQRHIK